MKKISLIVLTMALVLSLCACRFGGNDEPTQPTTATQPTAPTTPAITDPPYTAPQMDPTIDTNIPDSNVDNDHMTDTQDGTSGDGIISGNDNFGNNVGSAIKQSRTMK